MRRIHNLSWMVVLLMSSFVFAEDAKDESGKAYIKYDPQVQRAMRSDTSRDIIIEGSDNVRYTAQRGGNFRSVQNNNLIYIIQRKLQPSYPGPAKDIKDIDLPIKSTTYYSLALVQIPSTTDSTEIRQKYLDEACKDYENKFKVFQNDEEKKAQLVIKEYQEQLSQTENQIRELEKRKAEAVASIQKKLLRADILAYLYKEKIKLELDQLEQRTKLEEVTKYLNRVASLPGEESKSEDEVLAINKELEDLSKDKNVSEERIAELKNKMQQAQENRRIAIRKSRNNPEFTISKAQFADVKITLIATEKRYQEVEKLIAQYELSEKSAADLTKIDAQLEELGKKKDTAIRVIKKNESILKDIKDHPVRVINKADYDAMHSEKTEKGLEDKEN